ncbi:hypothetical protein [Nocardia farcinica]|uniref:hypothetical protein n=1 Tax=Nocardia farcinica TaxID=37329 RepID=UPI0024564516|nr:hypothetical protein [Nocardia farcinica]
MHEDLDRIVELNTTIGRIRGKAVSPDGAVYMEVDLYGEITSLRLSDFAMERGPERFARLVADCHRRAHSEALEEARLLHRAAKERENLRGTW